MIYRNLLISWQAVTIVSSSWAIAGEISSYRLRAKTQGIAVISNAFSTWLFTFTVAYIYNVDAGGIRIWRWIAAFLRRIMSLGTGLKRVIDRRGGLDIRAENSSVEDSRACWESKGRGLGYGSQLGTREESIGVEKLRLVMIP